MMAAGVDAVDVVDAVADAMHAAVAEDLKMILASAGEFAVPQLPLKAPNR